MFQAEPFDVAVSTPNPLTKETTVVIQLPGSRLSADEVDEVVRMMLRRIGEGQRRICLDFTALVHADSRLLSSLLEVQRRIKAEGGTLMLCSLNANIRQMLALTQLDRFLPIYPDCKAAATAA